MQKQCIFLMGPTAVGKTALALQLAEKLPVDIISVDSAMVYKGMDIGTGKPNPQELARFPHALVDICDPLEPYSAAQFCIDATHAIQQSFANDRIPLLVGGTMLYFKALQFGLSDLPEAKPALRAELLQQAQTYGWQAMHSKLAEYDPKAASTLNPHDTQRIQRALEINILTGKTLEENYSLSKRNKPDFQIQAFAILPDDRATLHTTIAKRFDKMLQDGFVAEVEKLYKRADLHPQLPAIRAVGYRQVWEYLNSTYDYATMRERAIAATRQLAKRQHTWLRSWPNLKVISAPNPALILNICQSGNS